MRSHSSCRWCRSALAKTTSGACGFCGGAPVPWGVVTADKPSVSSTLTVVWKRSAGGTFGGSLLAKHAQPMPQDTGRERGAELRKALA